jgi:all-trans-retinol dehydrogenase (NAD+)
MRTLKDKRVLITGGASGIGYAMAQQFGAQGARLVLTDINEPLLAQAAERLRDAGVEVTEYRLDVTDPDDVARARDRINADGGLIDVLVNNAGTVFGGCFLDVPLDKHLTTFEVNLLGPVILTHVFLPDLIDRPDAHLVNIASVAGYGGAPGGSTYGASKWGVIGFSESIELELRKLGHDHVHVTTVCPGVVSTGLFEGTRPLRLTRTLRAEDVAEAVVRGVLHNSSYVRTPWLAKVAPVLRGVLPHRVFTSVNGLFGGTTAMDMWTGREPGITPPVESLATHAPSSQPTIPRSAEAPGATEAPGAAEDYSPTSV